MVFFPRPIRACCRFMVRLNLLQVSLARLIILFTQISYPDFYYSSSIPLISSERFCGGYLYPCHLMNVRPKTIPLSNLFLSSMANSNFEDELLFREADFLEIEDEPTPDLNRALNLTLAGKLLAINRPSLSNLTFFASRTWDCPNRLSVFDHGKGLYTFQFVLDSDVLRVVLGGPWFIEGKLLLIQRINPNLSINNLIFENTKIWVRCFDLPPKAFNSKFAKAIGNMLGCYCDSDLQEAEGDFQLPSVTRLPSVRKFLRIKVTINLAFPLKRSQVIRIRNIVENKFDEILVKLAYERLPALFCYRCGLLGHALEKCTKEGQVLYGDWIRAEKYYRMAANNMEVNPPQTDFPQELSTQSHPQAISSSTVLNLQTPDPNIILANFKEIREMGPLPTVPLLKDNHSTDPNPNASTSLIGITPDNQAQTAIVISHEEVLNSQIFAPAKPYASILGAVPLAKVKPSEKQLSFNPTSLSGPTYFNPKIPSSDLFSPNTQRCLFKSDLVHPALASQPKAVASSPPNLSPIGPLSSNQFAAISSGSEITKESAVQKGKRHAVASKGIDTPKPKRGRPPAGAAKNA